MGNPLHRTTWWLHSHVLCVRIIRIGAEGGCSICWTSSGSCSGGQPRITHHHTRQFERPFLQ
jgi:hypothetical protein